MQFVIRLIFQFYRCVLLDDRKVPCGEEAQIQASALW